MVTPRGPPGGPGSPQDRGGVPDLGAWWPFAGRFGSKIAKGVGTLEHGGPPRPAVALQGQVWAAVSVDLGVVVLFYGAWGICDGPQHLDREGLGVR
jgi:hypothetical protein